MRSFADGGYMTRLEQLRKCNPSTVIHSIDEPCFRKYARVVASPAFASIAKYVDEHTVILDHNVYEPDLPGAHTPEIDEEVDKFYGMLHAQIGYCNGPNQTINGLEYHRGPEITIAITDCVVFWASPDDMDNFDTIDSSLAEVFFIPAGTAVLLKSDVMHLAPCEADTKGFKAVIILPWGTNLPLNPEQKARIKASGDPEAKLLHMANKWMISHKDREPLVKQGVHIGLTGENRRIVPIDL